MIIGTILGDGYLRVVKGRKNAFLEINHSIKQKEYVDWKYNILKNITKSAPKIRSCDNGRIAYRFYTRQLPELTKLYRMFYENKVKFIPESLQLNPVILSTWFMDDGSKCRKTDVYLNTQQFNIKDQMILIKILKNMNLEARLNRDKKYHRIRFLKSSFITLKDIIDKHIISSMKYKIEL